MKKLEPLWSGTVMWWRGKDVTKMTKAELIQALYDISQMYDQELKRLKSIKEGGEVDE